MMKITITIEDATPDVLAALAAIPATRSIATFGQNLTPDFGAIQAGVAPSSSVLALSSAEGRAYYEKLTKDVESPDVMGAASVAEPPKRGRGRPRKAAPPIEDMSGLVSVAVGGVASPDFQIITPTVVSFTVPDKLSTENGFDGIFSKMPESVASGADTHSGAEPLVQTFASLNDAMVAYIEAFSFEAAVALTVREGVKRFREVPAERHAALSAEIAQAIATKTGIA